MHFDTKAYGGRLLAVVMLAAMPALTRAQTGFQLQPGPVSSLMPGATGGSTIIPMAINDSGVIAGYYRAFSSGGGPGAVTAFTGPSSDLVAVTAVGGDGNPGTLPTSSLTSNGISWGLGINSNGNLAGSYSEGEYVATYSTPGTAVVSPPLQTLSTMNSILYNPNGNVSTLGFVGTGGFGPAGFGAGINAEGDVAGGAYGATNATHPFVYTAATQSVVDIGGGNEGVAYAINSTGTVAAGFSSPNTGTNLNQAKTLKAATIWTLNSGSWMAQSLPSVNPAAGSTGQSIAYGMNSSGVLCGVSDVGDGATSSFKYAPDATVWVNNGGTYTAIDLNGAGSGNGVTLASPLGVNWNNYYVYDPLDYLGTSGSQQKVSSLADAINDGNQIVGYSYFNNGDSQVPGDSGTKSAALWTLNSDDSVTEVDLNAYAPASYHFTEATGINNEGDVVGYGTYNGAEVPFEITGLPIITPAVPEPASLLLSAIGAACLLGRRSRPSFR